MTIHQHLETDTDTNCRRLLLMAASTSKGLSSGSNATHAPEDQLILVQKQRYAYIVCK